MSKPAVMHAIAIRDPGPDAKLELEERPIPAPKEGEVLIAVKAAGLNRADLLQARGMYPPPPGASDIPGLEAAGEIMETGAGVPHGRVGERVCVLLAGGGYATHVAASASLALPLPAHVSWAEGGALAEAVFTVWTNLFDTARLKPGETVLVHGGASGIGTTALQILKARGHRTFATAGGPEKCAACLKLGAARAIDYRREDFVAVVQQETGGKGVDVILDMVGGDYIQKNIKALAVEGRLVNIAYQNGATVEVNFAPVLMKRLTLAATTLRARSVAQKAAIAAAVRAEVWPLVDSGKLRPVVDSTFPLKEAARAHARMASGAHVGKIVLTV